MPHPQRQFDDEATLRTDEQAGTPTDQLKRAEKVFDPDPTHAPQAQPTNQKKPKRVTHPAGQVRTDEAQDQSQSLHKASPTDV